MSQVASWPLGTSFPPCLVKLPPTSLLWLFSYLARFCLKSQQGRHASIALLRVQCSSRRLMERTASLRLSSISVSEYFAHSETRLLHYEACLLHMKIIWLLSSFWVRNSLRSPGGLGLSLFLPQPFVCWEDRRTAMSAVSEASWFLYYQLFLFFIYILCIVLFLVLFLTLRSWTTFFCLLLVTAFHCHDQTLEGKTYGV